MIKKYQLQFLEQYEGASKETIKEILFAEIAGWMLSHIRQGLSFIGEEQLVSLIDEAFKLPRFVLAKQYYADNRHRIRLQLICSENQTRTNTYSS